MKEASTSKDHLDHDQLDSLYSDIVTYDQHAFQLMLQSREDEKKSDANKGWSILGYIKKFYGFIMMLGLMKILLFPNLTEKPIPIIKDPTNM